MSLSSLFSLLSFLCSLPGTDPFLYHPAILGSNHCVLRPRDRPFSVPSRHSGIEPLHPSTYLSWSCHTAILGTPLLLMTLSLRRRCCAVAVAVGFFFVFRQSKTLAFVGLMHPRYGTPAFGEFHPVASHDVVNPHPFTPGRSPHCVEKGDVRSPHQREMPHSHPRSWSRRSSVGAAASLKLA